MNIAAQKVATSKQGGKNTIVHGVDKKLLLEKDTVNGYGSMEGKDQLFMPMKNANWHGMKNQKKSEALYILMEILKDL